MQLWSGELGRLVSRRVSQPPLSHARLAIPSLLAGPLDTSRPITCKVAPRTAKRNIGGEDEGAGGEKKSLNPTVARKLFRPHWSVLTLNCPERRLLAGEGGASMQLVLSRSPSLSFSFSLYLCLSHFLILHLSLAVFPLQLFFQIK